MSRRLPPLPALDWSDPRGPRDRDHDDVYYSAADGLAEARAVFLAGSGLPERWRRGGDFTIAELGFGTGLNFLASWELWNQTAPGGGWLNFVSFEGRPLDPSEAARALSAWPELAPLTDKLIERWPPRARGVRRMVWPEDRVSLTLQVDEVAAALPVARFRADAWFLDGFAPARNPEMWGEALFSEMARRSAAGATAATYTVAGAVRRGLEGAGFSVGKRPGFGKKRERLEAVYSGAGRAGGVKPNTVAVVGAGIMGAAAARAFLDRGAAVTVFDDAQAPGAGASGNPLALVMPRLDAADTVQARLLIDAYLQARCFYAGRPGVEVCETWQRPRDQVDADRFAKVLADPPLALEDLEALAGGGLLHKRSLIVRPGELLPDLLCGAEMRLGVSADIDAKSRAVNGERFDAIVLANGMAAQTIPGFDWLGLAGRLGQVEHVATASRTAPSALASGHYALTTGTERLVGATFADDPGGAPRATDAAQAENVAAMKALAPYLAGAFEAGPITSRAGMRATTADRLPICGPAPDIAGAIEAWSGMRKGRPVETDASRIDGIYLATGLGSRGFTWAPWMAAILVSEAFGDAAPATIPALAAVSPARIIARGLKRGTL